MIDATGVTVACFFQEVAYELGGSSSAMLDEFEMGRVPQVAQEYIERHENAQNRGVRVWY